MKKNDKIVKIVNKEVLIKVIASKKRRNKRRKMVILRKLMISKLCNLNE